MDNHVREFGWSEEEKEYYYAKAEQRLIEAGSEEEVDREKFKISPEGVTIALKPFRKGSRKAQNRWSKLKTVKGFEEARVNNQIGKKDSRMHHGQIRLPWREQGGQQK